MATQPAALDAFATFGDMLKYLRRRERLTQLELSIAVGYSEAQISRLEKNQRLPDVAAINALFIPALHLEGEPALRAQLLALAESSRQEDAPLPGVAPYKGLLYFDETDADLFFGREVLTAHLVDRVTTLGQDVGSRILAIVGASGSGKSSLVRAGLAVALKRAGWTTHIMTPTAAPLSRLEAELHLPAGPGGSPVLLIVDQFEEVFTLCHDEAVRAAFIDRLLALSDPGAQDSGAITVVIVLRADFYAHCAQYPLLRQTLAAQQEYIGQMTTAELRCAIEEPARRAGWEFEPGLVDLLLHDIGAYEGGTPEPGALPLLSHALLATWERRRKRTLTLDGYHAAGGVRGAIAETAESVFTDQLDAEQQLLARDVFLRLTELGAGTEDTRRRAALTELERHPEEAAQLRGMLNTLAGARLITLNEDSAEVAHEALIREWERLHEWLMEDREGLHVHRHLTEAAAEWTGLGRDAGSLYRGARLAQAHEWAAANDARLNAAERAFLAASLEQEQHEALEREAQRQRELDAAQSLAAEQAQRAEEQARAAQKLRRRALMLGAALLLVVVLAGAALALGSQAVANAGTADAERQVALGREVAASALNSLSTDPERSILLALQAVRISTEDAKPVLVEAEDALHQAVETSRLRTTLRGPNTQLWSLALSKDGTQLATVGQDGTARIWDLTTSQIVTTLPTDVTDNIPGTAAVFSPDAKRLLTVSGDNTATLWDVATGKALFPLRGHTGLVTSVAIGPDGKLFATASNDMTVKLWDAATGTEIRTLTGLEGYALQIAFTPDGKRIFAASDDTGIVMAWDAASGKELFRFGGQGATVGVLGMAVSPDGTQLATGEFDTTVKLWDAATGKQLLTLFGHASQVAGVAYSPDGRYLASGSEDGTIKLWDAQTGRELLTLAGHTSGVLSVVFSLDGGSLYSVSRDGTARIWDISATAGHDWLNLVGHSGRVIGVGYRPDGAQVATWSHDGTVKLWDAATGAVQHTMTIEDVASGGDPGYSPDSKKVAVISGNRVVVFDAQTGAELFALPPFDGPAIQTLFSHDGTRLVVGGHEGLIRVFDSTDGKQLSEFSITREGSDGTLWYIALSPDGTRLGTAQSDGAFVWDLATGKQLVAYSGHGEGARTSGITFSPDGKWAATTGNDGIVQVWDAATGTTIFKLAGHTGAGFGVAFSPDGQSLASTSVDRTVKVWRLPPVGGQVPEPLTLHGHTGAVYSLAFSPDGTRLATVGRNQVARIYALNLEDLVAIAQSQVTRSLTPEECRKYLHTDTCPATTSGE